VKFPDVFNTYFKNKDEILNFSVINISENQKIALLNIDKMDLSEENFIFQNSYVELSEQCE
jgi:hypothetical protein